MIRRNIKRDGNKSTFTLNGKQSTKTQVIELARSFSIQVDNLCQFLPQDKVCEFAALSPVELLHSTQRAAAGSEMIEWHDELKSLRGEQKQLQNSNVGDRELLANLENKQEIQREDVDRMRQREEVKKRLGYLEKSRPLPRLREARQTCMEAREKKQELQREQRELEIQLEPALRAVNAKQEYCKGVDTALKQKKQMVDRADALAKSTGDKMVQMEEALKELESRIMAEKTTAKGRRTEYRKIKQAINRLDREIEEAPPEFNATEYTEKIVSLATPSLSTCLISMGHD